MYPENENGIFYQKYEGNDSSVTLPDSIDGRPITGIAAKAFLSCKEIKKLSLPDSVRTIEDWAFAHMKNLTDLTLPATEITFGKKVFLGCEQLSRIHLSKCDNLPCGLDGLLATAFYLFPECIPGNLTILTAKEGISDWVRTYDRALLSYLRDSDEEGFVPAFIGWFDVEDLDDQKAGYMRGQRLQKIRLAYQRLVCSDSLPDEKELGDLSVLYAFLREQSELILYTITEQTLHPESVSDTAKLPEALSFYKQWDLSGGLTADITDRLLILANLDIEVKHFLIDKKRKASGGRNLFDDLAL